MQLHDAANGIIHKQCQHQHHLDPKPDTVGENVGQRYRQAGKIHLAKQSRVAGKGAGVAGQAVGKIGLDGGAGQIKQQLRHAVGAQSGNTAKNHHIHDSRHERVDKEPQRAQNGLLVQRCEIALGK